MADSEASMREKGEMEKKKMEEREGTGGGRGEERRGGGEGWRNAPRKIIVL